MLIVGYERVRNIGHQVNSAVNSMTLGILFIFFYIVRLLLFLSRGHGRHSIRHVIEKHAPDHEEELSRDGDGGPLSSPEVFQLEVLQPHCGILRDEDPRALHEIGPHPLVAAPCDPPLARPFPC